jgi:hypothetical protein
MLNIVMLSVVLILQTVVILGVIILNVVAPLTPSLLFTEMIIDGTVAHMSGFPR